MKTIKISDIYWTKSLAARLASSYMNEAHKVDELMQDDATRRNEELRRVLSEQSSLIWKEYNRVNDSNLTEITENDVKRIDDELRREWCYSQYDDVSDLLQSTRIKFLDSVDSVWKADGKTAEKEA